ncbi:MAG: hypothetical protein LUI10_03260 [Lachnospiraceae bacterium]|nr:hypothetical protein [Lachnospiraceae bacterium]
MNDRDTVYWMIEYGAAFTEYYLSLFFCGTWIGQRTSEKKTLPKILACAVISFITLAVNRADLYSPVSVVLGVLLMIALQLVFYYRSAVKASMSGLIFLLLMVLLDNVTVSMIS